MYDALFMRVTESRKDLAHIINGFQIMDRSRFQPKRQRSPLHQFHCHHKLAFNLRCVKEGDDIGMAQTAVYLDLSKESLHSFLIVLNAARQDPEHLYTSIFDVSDLVSHAGFGAVEDIEEFVPSNCSADFKCHTLSCCL